MVILILIVLGLSLGSFVNALVWRLHMQTKRRELKADLSITKGRSICPNCQHVLAPQDLIPLLSWLWLKGKCRYCGKPISWQYPLVEALTAALFVFSYIYWPYLWHAQGITLFVFWLALLTGFMALIIYDLRWLTLPNRIVYPLLGLVITQVVLQVTLFNGGGEALLSAFWGLLLLGGLFYALFQLSGGKWIGGGDVKLGAVLGLLVGGPSEALLLLFMASLMGTLASLPLLATGKLGKHKRIPFGPFLIGAGVIVYLFGASIISWYRRLAGI